ncbi:zinc finger Y-chromosomal protein 2 [Manduca sexta]|uniref:Uncharacterized protein n=1 Tax=Manduca sexta TaxID=7130 RepID=A0A922CXE6_MANSE|nr:zinc finger Y-chromosomal protein 2 [Manduca sexta]KAG6461508.1 hypothetical protein O3G_MSEX012682 [Manduca sexta]
MAKSRCFLGCDEDNPIYFGFPTSRAKYKKWLSLMNKTGNVTPDDVLCHRHFATSDYERIRGKFRLKKNVMPSLLLTGESETTATTITISSESAQDKSSTPEQDSRIDTGEKPPDDSTQKPPDKLVDNGETAESTSKTKPSEVAEDSLNKSCEQNNKSDSDSSSSVICNSEDSVLSESNVKTVHRPQTPDAGQDIEDIITNYHIRNKKPNKLVSPPREIESPVIEVACQTEPPKEPDPVFIEVSVDQDPNASNPEAGSQDCLMLLESLQVEVDPTMLLLPERDEDDDSDDDVQEVERKDDPISLVTSSDEDEVIIQEPEIDTVEVSSGSDEDDVPLVKLVKKKPKEGRKKKSNYRPPANIAKIMWGLCEYYCLQCKYNTTSKSDYTRHLKHHETVLHICQICGYTTSSKQQFWRHKRKHKAEKRFKCHLCEYKARHSMSLVYHLKSHDRKNGVECGKCGLYFIEKRNAARHLKNCTGKGKVYPCKLCSYMTKRLSDLRRHVNSIHGDDDVDYIPSYYVFHFTLYSCINFSILLNF